MKIVILLPVMMIAAGINSNYAQDTWVKKADFGGGTRIGAVAFSIGDKGYIGTGFGTAYKKDFWEYDPDADTWTQKADFGGIARSDATGFNIGSKGYVGTGQFYDITSHYFADLWEFDPAANSWTQKADFAGSARFNAVGFSIDTKGYLGTGDEGGYDFTSDFWEYDPDADIWTQKSDVPGGTRAQAVGLSIGTKGYIGTGNTDKDFWEYDPNSDTWIQKADFEGGYRMDATGFSIGIKGYIGTGDYNGLKKDFWEYNPDANTWTKKADFGGSPRSDAIGFSIGGKGYIGTGFDGLFYKKDFWEYTPDCPSLKVYADADGDNYGDASNGFFVSDCVVPFGYVYNDSSDCDDNNAEIHPGVCDASNGNGLDDNCDGIIDDDFGTIIYFVDEDGDGYGAGTGTALCADPGAGYSTYGTDCDDADSTENPDATEILNGLDDNCDDLVDLDLWVQKNDLGYDAINVTAPALPVAGFNIGSKGYIATGASSENFWEYDPGTDTWSQKADFSGTDISKGFSIGSNGYVGTSTKDFWEYNPDANTWIQKEDFPGTTNMNSGVGFSIGSKGYFGTGWDGATYKKDFWEYDPDTDTWIQKADFGGVARTGGVGFSIGSKGYIGTGRSGSWPYSYYKDFWEYDPNVNTWSQKADFGGASREGAVGFSIANTGYIGTGYYFANSDYHLIDNVYSDFWAYNPVDNKWTQKAAVAGGDRSFAVGFSIGEKGYVGTGYNGWMSKKDFYEYDPVSDTWVRKADFGSNTRSNATGFSIGNKGYIGTGITGEYERDFWEYDADAGTWAQKADFGGSARAGATSFSIGAKGYIGTGYNYANGDGYYDNYISYLNDFWEYDPIANKWTKKADFAGGPRTATGFSIGDKGYIGTGLFSYYLYYYGSYNFYYKDFWEYDPAIDTWTQKADFGGGERSDAVGLSIGNKGYIGTGSTKDFWEYDPTIDTWTQKADYGGGWRAGAVAFSIDSLGYVGTGYENGIGDTKDFWEYNPKTDTWTKKANCGTHVRSNAVGFSIGSRGYIGTGEVYPTNYNDFWEYTPGGSNCISPTNLSVTNTTSSSAKLTWNAEPGTLGYKVKYKVAGTSEWTKIASGDNNKSLSNLVPNTEYAWQVKSICDVLPIVSSDWSEKQFFTTDDLRLSESMNYEITLEVYPNPVSQSATVSFSLTEGSSVMIELMDVNGRSIRIITDADFSEGNHDVPFNRESLNAGIYFLQMKTNEGVMMMKVIME